MMEMELVDEMEVSCEICRKDLPRSGATAAESGDRAVHFCGLDCYEEWTEQRQLEELKLLTE
jgi:hypothetical protein